MNDRPTGPTFIGRGFAPRQPFLFFRRRRRFYNYQSYLGFDSRQSLSFSHVNVGDAFHFMNDISQRKTNRSEWCRGKALAFKSIGRFGGRRTPFLWFSIQAPYPYRRLIQPPEGDRLLYGVLHQPMISRLNRRI